MCSSGGSGGSSVTQEFKPPSYTVEPWKDYMAQAQTAATNTGTYKPYPGQVIAGMTPEQTSGLNLTAQTAMNSSPDVLAGRGNIQSTAQGDYLNNPWTGAQSTLGQTAGGSMLNSNPWLSPGYTNAVIDQNAANMTNAYRTGTAAQTDAAAARQGAFGGSAYGQMTANNNAGLANSIGQMANQYRLANQSMGAQNFQQERALQQAAGVVGANMYGQERGNMLQASALAPYMQNMDLQAGSALTGVGDVYRSYQQDLLNQSLSNWNQQQQAPLQGLDVLGNALARASGNAAGGTSAVTTNPYQASPYASLLGLGLGAYGLYGGGG